MLLNDCKNIDLTVGKTKYMELRRHRGMMANELIIGSNSYEKVKTFQYL